MTGAERIEAEAARWVARRDAAALSAEETIAFEAWLARDSRHLGAVVRLEAVNARLARAAALQGIGDVPPRPSVRRWLPAAIAASIALSLGAAWQVGLLAPTWQAESQSRQLSTRLGEQYRARLVDGSTVELNTDTRLAVAIVPRVRKVELTTGEAAFEVARDPVRPFVVSTPLGDVRAIGTVFSVNLERGLEVVVAEGIVAVEKGGREIARVSAGERYRLTSTGEAARKGEAPDAINRALAWREGKVAFAGETLAEAAAQFNRYNRIRIQIADPAVATMRFGGYFRATDPEGFARALEGALPVEATREGDVIRLAMR